jgi:hypothetical protein
MNWLARQAATHFAQSSNRRLTAKRRTWHRGRFLAMVANLLGVLTDDDAVRLFKLNLRGRAKADPEGEPVIRALAATMKSKPVTSEVSEAT